MRAGKGRGPSMEGQELRYEDIELSPLWPSSQDNKATYIQPFEIYIQIEMTWAQIDITHITH